MTPRRSAALPIAHPVGDFISCKLALVLDDISDRILAQPGVLDRFAEPAETDVDPTIMPIEPWRMRALAGGRRPRGRRLAGVLILEQHAAAQLEKMILDRVFIPSVLHDEVTKCLQTALDLLVIPFELGCGRNWV